MTEDTGQIELSIIIPAYNEQELLPGCLDAVIHQTADPGRYQIMVIDNNSTDATAAIARARGIKVEKETRKGYVHAIRKGVEVTEGRLIAFMDADCRPSPNWVETILKDFEEHPDILAVGGKLDFFDLDPVFTWITKTILSFTDVLPGSDMAVKRDALERAGGIDPRVNLSADYWLTRKLKRIGKIKIDKNLVVFASGRRFGSAFGTHLKYLANVIVINLLGHPAFYDFTDVRKG
jgi:glycosyltransferase involved in cell wall biosynthesis